MGDPRNPKRADEEWDPHRVAVMEHEILTGIRPLGAVSGGWAWHFLSPRPHVEKKLFHDHKDVDLIVEPQDAAFAFASFQGEGYRRIWTRYDKVSKSDFYRYEKHVDGVKILVDMFLAAVNHTILSDTGIKIVEPKTLLSWYGVKHTTDDCVAVKAARRLIERCIDPVGRKELIGG